MFEREWNPDHSSTWQLFVQRELDEEKRIPAPATARTVSDDAPPSLTAAYKLTDDGLMYVFIRDLDLAIAIEPDGFLRSVTNQEMFDAINVKSQPLRLKARITRMVESDSFPMLKAKP